jgi:adenylate cyclase
MSAAIGLVLAGLRLAAPKPLEILDDKTLDFRHVLRGPLPPDPAITIVGIDEASLAALGRWPWPRARIATLVDALSGGGAAAIGFDVVFDQRDEALDLSTAADLVRDAPDRPSRELLAELSGYGDRALAASLRASGRVVLAFFAELDGPPDPQLAADAARVPQLAVRQLGGDDAAGRALIPAVRRLHVPVPALAAAADLGHINVLPDADGLYRRLPLVLRAGDRLLPAFSLRLAARLQRGGALMITLARDGVHDLRLGERVLTTNPAAEVWVNHLGPPGRFRRVSAADVLAGRVPADAIRDRIVLVGFTAAGFDEISTPFAPVVPGVELQATAVDNLLLGRSLWRPWWAVPAEAFLIVGLALATGLALQRLSVGPAVVVALALALVYGGLSQLCFSRFGLALGAFYPLAGMSFALLGGAVYQAVTEQREKQAVREAFRHYLSPEVTELLASDPSRLQLGGHRSPLTILFSDIRGFTTLAEQMPPETLGQFLIEYLSAMTDVVFRHKGLVDKYIGDAVMAFWGAPVAIPDHAVRCCEAALDMLDALEGLNADWETRGLPRLEIGIGIHTGEPIVGNFGSVDRFDYTAVGDDVNLTSRLEGMNKAYGTHVLISESTLAAVEGRFATREVARIRVRGREQETVIHELLGRRGEHDESREPAARGA